MTPAFDDIPVLHVEDHICLTDRRQTVSDNETRSAFHHLQERRLDTNLRQRINAARRFVEN